MVASGELTGSVILTGVAEREGDQFVSYCRELGTASCGDTIEEALKNLGDAIEVHIGALTETGELQRVLREKNIRIDIQPPSSDELFVRIPPGKIVTTYSHQVPLAGVA